MVGLLIAGIITFIIVLLFAILLLPITVIMDTCRSGGKIDGNFSVRWLLLNMKYALKNKRTELFVFNRRLFSSSHMEKQAGEIKQINKKKSGKTPDARDVFYLIRPMLRFLKDLVFTIKIKNLDFNLKFGLENPAYTGMMTGILHAAGLSKYSRNIVWTADFTGPVLDWDIKAKVTITLVHTLLPVLRLITNRHVIRSGLHIVRG